MMNEKTIEVTSISQLLSPQVRALIGKAKIKAKGAFNPPAFDLAAIKERADKLDPTTQVRTDIFMLLLEVERLNNG